jgi:hypothetical protein
MQKSKCKIPESDNPQSAFCTLHFELNLRRLGFETLKNKGKALGRAVRRRDRRCRGGVYRLGGRGRAPVPP